MDERTRPQVSHNLLGKPLREGAPRLTTATWKTRAFGLGFPQLRSRYDDDSFLFEKNAERGLTAYRGTQFECYRCGGWHPHEGNNAMMVLGPAQDVKEKENIVMRVQPSRKQTQPVIVIALAAVVALSLVFSAIPAAASEGQATRSYTSPLVIPAADFSDCGFPQDGYEFWPAMGFVRGLGFHVLKAPVYLPHGATITAVNAVLYDNVQGINMQVFLFRCNSTTGSVDTMTQIFSPTSSQIQEVPNPNPVSFPTVSYPDFFYYVAVEFAATDHRLYAVRIDYTE